MLPKDWWDSFCLKMDKSSIGKPLTCGLSLTQLEFPLRTSWPGNYNLIFQFLSQDVLFNSEIYDLIICSICFTAVLRATICDLEGDLSQ